MKTDDLPESNNIEDRRSKTYRKPRALSLNEMAMMKPLAAPDPTGTLARDAGVDDIPKK